MTSTPTPGRTDTASRIVRASPQAIYRAFLNPDALVKWLPPKGMTARLEAFDPRVGGSYRMVLTYGESDPSVRGKTAEDTDVVEGRFVELVPDERVVQVVTFQSDDPAFAGAMTMAWSLSSQPDGTLVRIVCDDVPPGIRPEDHDVGLKSTLGNLAEFVE